MNTVILLAAGKSQRANSDKIWADIHGRPLWTLSYETFLNHPAIDEIILVVPKGGEKKFVKFIGEKTKIVAGGETRMKSFLNGMKKAKADLILDHNAANPNVSAKEITEVIKQAKKYGAAALSLEAVDTVISSTGNFYEKVYPRKKLRLMQTPQAVRADILKKIDLKEASDLTSALLDKTKVRMVKASPSNRKITFKEDLSSIKNHSFVGEDSHEFSKSGNLVLGGLKIKELPALSANSDGDVVLHAIGRALAAAQDKSFSKIADAICESGEKNSAAYLRTLLKNIEVEMLSLQIECKKPKIDSLPLKKSLSKILNIHESKIRINAMSGEGLTAFGRGEAIRAICIITCHERS